jgi:ribonuclease D
MTLPEPPPPAAWIERTEELERLCARLGTAARVALDTEANSLHAYRERTCVVQLATAEESAILDPLALPSLEPLRAALSRPDVEVVLHGGDYDIAVLSRDHGFAFERVFDTMIAATLLGEERVGLADLARAHLGVELDKRFQKADWARRPLSAAHLVYLQGDTQWLLALRDLLAARLAEQDLVEEAEIEFRRLARRRGKPHAPDPERWREVKGAEALDADGRAALHVLWAWREAEAERRDVPAFMVLPPLALLTLAREAPRAADPRHPLPGLGAREAGRYGRALREALERGLHLAREGRAPPPRERERPTEAGREAARLRRKREEALKAWRRTEAHTRRVPNVVVLPNPALEWLLAQGAATLEELAAHPDVGPKRAARYGAAILAALASVPSA